MADGSLTVGKMGEYRSSLPHHHLLPRLRTSGATPLLPGYTATTLPLTLHIHLSWKEIRRADLYPIVESSVHMDIITNTRGPSLSERGHDRVANDRAAAVNCPQLSYSLRSYNLSLQ